MPSGLHAQVLAETQIKLWDDFVNGSQWGDILQFHGWAETKSREGWQNLRVGVFDGKDLVLGVQVLFKKASFLGNYAYVPHGPVFHSIHDLERSLPVLVKFFQEISKKYSFFCLEVEPKIGHLASDLSIVTDSAHNNLNHFYNPSILEIFNQNGFRVTSRNMQPKHKLYYDLELSEGELLAQCQKTTRYNIRLSEKKGVKVEEYLPDSDLINEKLEKFYELLLETQQRSNGYPIRSLASFKKLFESFKGTQNLSLFEASYQGQTIAINISQRTSWWSSSFYAASNRLFPEVKAMYLLRWRSIMSAKKFGSKTYDFWGVILNSGQHSGYSDHKLSFGGLRVDTYGLLALPFKQLSFDIWDKGILFRTKSKDFVRKIVWNFKKN